MLRRLGRVEHVWYTIACAAAQAVAATKQLRLYTHERRRAGRRDDDGNFSGTAPKCAPSGPHLGRAARPERVEVSCQLSGRQGEGPRSGSRVDECRSRTSRRLGGERPYAKV